MANSPTARDVAHQVFALCEATEDIDPKLGDSDAAGHFLRGRRFEAKQIRRAIGTWLTDEENRLAPAPSQAQAGGVQCTTHCQRYEDGDGMCYGACFYAPEARETAEPAFATDRSFGWCPDQCPITRLPFFMWIQHPRDGWVPTYGGPLDSYTIPVMGGLPTEPFHERPLERERFDHDAGYWVDGVEEIPLRVAHDDALAAPVSQAEPSTSQAASDVLAERQRQIEKEGWTPKHDDEHDDGVMALAAAGYAHAAFWNAFKPDEAFTADDPPPGWPEEWDFKPADPRRMLVKACALALAEIERKDRAARASHEEKGQG